jgi:hypothetical protein
MESGMKNYDIRWSAVETFTGVNCLGECKTFRFRYCSLCGGKVLDDQRALAGHAENHSTGEHERQERAFFERLCEVNREQGWKV